MKDKTKEFLNLSWKIFIFLNIIFFINGGFLEEYQLDENIARYSGTIIGAFFYSAIWVYLLKPCGRFFKKKFVQED